MADGRWKPKHTKKVYLPNWTTYQSLYGQMVGPICVEAKRVSTHAKRADEKPPPQLGTFCGEFQASWRTSMARPEGAPQQEEETDLIHSTSLGVATF
ncbi:hypothetical protein PAAG_05956 [Paracoccidioides lutzii Pb01]|uniref:Uncharacterized protein n=1 Tax=Paracoccidioides lutzii (strain ATCC MYA-826 / Pb01) TaxID=502779 RepID=C1H5B5_PARBA|nr:hypothetical protein PAAG_05956 [Paracoccidioides lutzii Pb01]EEH34909.2 hypothetical protein PAAG_05956 [Paracoccidioides lutzii Pb01]